MLASELKSLQSLPGLKYNTGWFCPKLICADWRISCFGICHNMAKHFLDCGNWPHSSQESSAKLTNQRVSYAFTSSPFSFHSRHTLPTSKFQHSYSCILLIFYRYQWTAWVRTLVRTENCESVSVNTVHWFDASCSVIPLNNTITLISPVQSLTGLHFLPLTVYA